MRRRLAVADIHGEAKRLEQVLAKARYDPNHDRLFLLGDYVDRGSEPARAVDLVRKLATNGAVALKGNHEHVCVRLCRGRVENRHWRGDMQLWLQQGGAITVADYGGTIPEDVLDWLDSLPLWHEEPDCILVHAGLRPGISLEKQDHDDLLWIRKEFHEGYCGKTVIFGHTPTKLLHGKVEPWYGVDKIGIDTGACYAETHGGCLTLFDLDTHETWTA